MSIAAEIVSAEAQLVYCLEQRRRLRGTPGAAAESLVTLEEEITQLYQTLRALDAPAKERAAARTKQMKEAVDLASHIIAADEDLQALLDDGGGDAAEKDLDDIRAEDLQQDGDDKDPFETFEEGEER